MRFLPILACSALFISIASSCERPKVNEPYYVGLVLPESALLVYPQTLQSAELAAAHILHSGGLRGGRALAIVRANSESTAQSGYAAMERISAESDVRVAVIVANPALHYDSSGNKGPGIFAAEHKMPVVLATTPLAAYDTPHTQSLFGGEASDLDPSCTQTPPLAECTTGGPTACCDPTQGTIQRSGYVYRALESNVRQNTELGKMIAADGRERTAMLLMDASYYASGAAAVAASLTANGKIVSRTVKVPETVDAGAMKALLGEAVAPDGEAPIDAIFYYGVPGSYNTFADAYAALPTKPALYVGSNFWNQGVIHYVGSTIIGARGLCYAKSGGPSPGTWDDEFAEATGGVPPDQIWSFTLQPTYDATIIAALAIYATGKDEPSGEEIKAALDKINDPNGTPIGYKDFATARKTLDAGGTINYKGVSGELDFDPLTNAVRTALMAVTVSAAGKAEVITMVP